MASRTYLSCSSCHGRMRLFEQDTAGGRRFYYCPKCGRRTTLMTQLNGTSEDWPTEVFDRAVETKVLSRAGNVVESPAR